MEYANQKNISRIAITSAPNIYNQENYDIQRKSLEKMGFLSQDYLVQVIKITPADFNSIIGADKRRYLKKCKDFTFKKLDSSYLKPLYDFIGQQRADKGYVLSIAYQQMEELMNKLPQAIALFGVFDGSSKLVAASISIHVNKGVLYDFHHDDLLEKRHLGATATLIKGIYEFCQTNSYKILDLGGSTLNNEINTGLYKYKKSLGAVDAHKTTYTLTR